VNHVQDSVTGATLLRRLQQTPADQAAWRPFVERHGERIDEGRAETCA
jgi:hypothetical protein